MDREPRTVGYYRKNMSARWSQDKFQKAFVFSSTAHAQQCMVGTELPYITHVACVCAELMCVIPENVNCDLAIQCAALHDTVEDTTVSVPVIRDNFGEEVANGVSALTKDRTVNKKEQLAESLERICRQPKEIWMVKMADRIVNLSRPPALWSKEKVAEYRKQSELLYDRLKTADRLLAERLRAKIESYKQYEK